MALENGGRLVSGKSRKIVQEFLSVMSSPEDLLEKIDGCTARVAAVADAGELVPVLAEALDEEDRKKMIVAAWFLTYIALPRPDMIREPELVERAEKTLVAALESNEKENRLFALKLLTVGGVPDSATTILRELLRHDDKRIKVNAAAALLGSNVGFSDAKAILADALIGDNETLVAVAARALARQPFAKRLVVQELIEAFHKSPPMGKYYVLQGLEELGAEAHGVSAAVAATILDKSLPPAVRGQAAETLGKIAVGEKSAVDRLFAVLSSQAWQVVVGAVKGLIAQGQAGERVGGKLATLLSATDANLRMAACLGLKAMEQQARSALPALIERLGDESDLNVCGAMIEAIVAIGVEVIPTLTEVIRQGDARRIRWAAVALVRMGTAAAQHLGEALGQESDTATRCAYVMLLRDMGWKAAPAVPALGRILDETDDEELAFLATAAIFVCGQAGAPAVPSLVRCLMNRGDETASAAERSLKLMGTPAVAALEEALESAEGTAKRRIEETLTYFRPSEEKRFRHLERIGRDDLIRLFVLVGAFLETEKKVGWRTIAEAIGHQITFRRIDGGRFGATANSISTGVKELRKLLKMKAPLTSHSKYRSGGLTPQGRKLLREAKDYLRRDNGDSATSTSHGSD